MPVAPAHFGSGRLVEAFGRAPGAFAPKQAGRRPEMRHAAAGRPVRRGRRATRRARFDEGAETIVCGGVSRRDAAASVGAEADRRRDTLLAGPRPSPARRSNRCDSVCADRTPRAPRAPRGGCSGRPFRAWTAACLVLLLLIRRCASPCVQPAPGLLRLRALTTGDRRACLQPRPPSVERAAGLTPPCEAALVERPAVATFHLRERTPLLRGGSSSAHQRGRQADPQRLERSVSANGRRGPASPSGAGGGVHRVQVQDRPDRVITRSLRRDRQVAADWRVVSWWPGFPCTAPGNSGSRAQSLVNWYQTIPAGNLRDVIWRSVQGFL